MKKLFIIIALVMVAGCSSTFTRIAYEVVKDWDDTNNYEAVRGINSVFCDPSNYDHLVNKLGKANADKLIIEQCNANTKSN